MLNLDDKAYEYFRMINPIEHSRTKEAANLYKVEPYVITADVYGKANLAGRGGWTWYTGSASWMFVCGIKYILGINVENGILKVEPHIPKNWNMYSVKLRYGESLYNIKIERIEDEIKRIKLNGEYLEKPELKLNKDGGIYNINVEI